MMLSSWTEWRRQPVFFADAALARRIEAAEAAIARGCARRGAATVDIAGGCAVFAGAGSPLTQAVGLGLNGPVSQTDLDSLAAFFRGYGAPVRVEVCPLADAGLLDGLAARGCRATEFNNVLAMPLAGYEAPPSPRVRRIGPGEEDLWSLTVGRGFFEEERLTPEEMDVGRDIAAMPAAECCLASEDGEAAAGAALAIGDGLATLFADGVIARFRRRGLHRELIAARLGEAVARGCELAAACTLPGSASQRNYERFGFRVVYSKATLVG
jgi:GNAT superfamily N-acetyltransferase